MKKYNIIQKLLLTVSTLSIFIALFSCQTMPKTSENPIEKEYEPILSRDLLGQGQLSVPQLCKYFLSQNPSYDPIKIANLAYDYVKEAAAENINSDVAFAQMCLETGYLKYGNLVTPDMNNFCGLGAMDAQNTGCVFPTPTIGVRAHIQHLQAYATTAEVELKQELVDPRYSWPHKAKYTKDIWGLSGTWATDPNYAIKIDNNLKKMEEFYK